jgi:hypothetical protein
VFARPRQLKKLTREEIALQLLAAIVSSMGHDGRSSFTDSESHLDIQYRKDACEAAFQMADLFIKKRDKKA